MYKLEFQQVSLLYKDEYNASSDLLALDKLNLCIDAGESVAIIGPSGCGKSSTLRMAAGLIQPTSGHVLVDGEDVLRPRQSTALILQDFGLLPWKSVLDNAALGLKVRGVSLAQRNAQAQKALELVDLQGFEAAFPGDLSGGMKQRLALARSLALNSDLLLMDEPLSALDALMREQLQDTLLELWLKQGYTQVLVTHSIDEAVFLGQRIVIMSARPGRIICIIDNPDVGSADYRGSTQYFELSTKLRSLLRQAVSDVEEVA